MDFEEREIPLTLQAKLLRLKQSSFYDEPVKPFEEEVRAKHRIDEIYTQNIIFRILSHNCYATSGELDDQAENWRAVYA